MKHCPKCGVDIRGQARSCPLCQRVLENTNDEEQPVYPIIPTLYHQFDILIRIVLFATIALAIISVAVNFMLPKSGYWSLFVVGGVVCFWISLYFIIQKRANIIKTITYQVVIVSALSVIWDVLTGWHGWSIDYVIPIVCVAAMVAGGVITRIKKVPIEDYMIYVVLGALFGIVPIIFLLTGSLRIVYPSLICIAFSLLSLIALFIFAGPSIKAELKKRLHL
jgi:hypothetical protein